MYFLHNQIFFFFRESFREAYTATEGERIAPHNQLQPLDSS